MIGTEVVFKLQKSDEWVFREGIIQDKIRMANARAISNVVDHYVILSNKQYHFIECSLIYYKQS